MRQFYRSDKKKRDESKRKKKEAKRIKRLSRKEGALPESPAFPSDPPVQAEGTA